MSRKGFYASWHKRPRYNATHWALFGFVSLVVGGLLAIHVQRPDGFYLMRASASGAIYYVATSGNDGNVGTDPGRPLKTIQAAANKVTPGDTVLVADGVYTDIDGDRHIVTINTGHGGNSGSFVTFKSMNPWGAKLDGLNNTAYAAFRFGSGVTHVRIEGFDIYGMGNGGTGGSSGIEIYNGGDYSQIIGNHFHDIAKGLCSNTSNGQVGLYLQRPGILVERNTFNDIGRLMNNENGSGCAAGYNGARDHGIYVNGTNGSGANSTVIRNNLFYNNKKGYSVQLYPGALNGVYVDNNTFAFDATQSGAIILGANISNSRIANNIFYNPRGYGINNYSGSFSSFDVVNNSTTSATLIGNRTFSGTNSTVENNLTNTSPLFVNATVAPYDFHLLPASPVKDAGLTIPEVVTDLDGVSRPQNSWYDIGAYEYGATLAGDTQSPAVNVTAPAAAATVSGTFNLVASATDNIGVVGVQFKVQGVNVGEEDTTAPYTTSWDTRTVNNGSYAITAVARDAAGNITISSANTVQVSNSDADTIVPTVTITQPTSATLPLRGKFTIASNASDNVRVTKIEILFDGSVKRTCTGTNITTCSTSLQSGNIASGGHVITSRATDASNNVGTATMNVTMP
jgi:hypothetical protein